MWYIMQRITDITNRKGVVIRPIYSEYNKDHNKIDKEIFHLLTCRKCERTIMDYPYFKNGFEKYYHILCALTIGQLSLNELEFLVKRLTTSIAVGNETIIILNQVMDSYVGKDKTIIKTKLSNNTDSR